MFGQRRLASVLLSKQDRLLLVLDAMAHPSIEVKIRAGRPLGRPAHEGRSIFLKEALRDDNPVVSEAAVWQAGIPARPAHGALSDLALKWLPNVVDRARWYLRFGAVPSAVNARGLHPPVRYGRRPEVTPD